MTTTRALGLVSILALQVCACSPNQTQSSTGDADALGPGKVATVNGQPIAESVLRVYALANRQNIDDMNAQDRGRLLDDLVGVELLKQEAESKNLTSSRTLAAQIELQRSQLIARAAVTDYLEKNPATPAEIQQLYDENLPRLSGQQFKARHILLETKEEAEGVIAELRGGKDFAALATEHADGPTGPSSDLGWFTADSMVAPVFQAVQTMEIGTYSQTPVQSEYGFHVLMLDDSRKQEPPSLDAVRDQLVAAIERKHVEEYLTGLRENADVSLTQ